MGGAFATASAKRTSHVVWLRGWHAGSSSAGAVSRQLGVRLADHNELLAADVVCVATPPALRAARSSFAPKTLESTSNFRPCESPPTSRESNAPENRTPSEQPRPRERLCVGRLPKLWFAITMRRIPIGRFED